MSLNRRQFIVGSAAVVGGGLVLGFTAYNVAASRTQVQAARLAERNGARLLAGWVTIAPDDTITVLVPHADVGQGTHTALAMILAEELDADWAKVRTHQAPADQAFANWFLAEGFTLEPGVLIDSGVADPVFKVAARSMGLQLTGGSTAVRCTGNFGMRHVGAAARLMLIDAAAERWGVSPAALTTRDSRVIHAAADRAFRYGELIERAAAMPVRSRPALKSKKLYRLVGQSPLRLDIPPKVLGFQIYGIDLRLPDLRYAATMAAPIHGGELTSLDPAPAMAMPGVQDVIELRDSVAVIALEPWQALNAVDALTPVFSDAHAANVSSRSIYEDQSRALRNGKAEVQLRIGHAAEQFAAAARSLESEYQAPFLHHAQMEPINITAQWQGGQLTLWSGAQDPLTARKFSAELAELPLEKVTLNPMPIGGSFGRKVGPDADCIYYRQSIEIARRCAPAPVKLIWSRAEDTMQGSYRPSASR